MTREERNAVIDECIVLVQSYNERAHKLALARAALSGKGPQVPHSATAVIAMGLRHLKEPEPLYIQVSVKTKHPV